MSAAIALPRRILKVLEPSATLPAQIRLRGQWLERAAGFRPGRRVLVTILGQGRLLIEEVSTSAPTKSSAGGAA
ncbi:MAG: hypothetical protein EXS31_06980 [Pedosphaera sp.]|nr:hypothetical protein [Pedosphaera sp.]